MYHNTILLAVTLLCLCDVITGSWTQAHRDQITKIHNDYRKAVPGACEMNTIKYDMQLEKEAKAWAKRCVFDHQRKTRGENIAWYTKYGSESELVTKMAKMWYDEVKDYTYGQNGCGAACHYTQMVWSKSTNVGCYAADCAHLEQGGNNAYFLVCFYSPAGNFEGENPYKKNCGANHKSKSANANHKSETSNHGAGNPSHNGGNNNQVNNVLPGGDGFAAWSTWETPDDSDSDWDSGNWNW